MYRLFRFISLCMYRCRGYPQVGSGSTVTVTTPKPTTPKPWVKPSCVDRY